MVRKQWGIKPKIIKNNLALHPSSTIIPYIHCQPSLVAKNKTAQSRMNFRSSKERLTWPSQDARYTISCLGDNTGHTNSTRFRKTRGRYVSSKIAIIQPMEITRILDFYAVQYPLLRWPNDRINKTHVIEKHYILTLQRTKKMLVGLKQYLLTSSTQTDLNPKKVQKQVYSAQLSISKSQFGCS